MKNLLLAAVLLLPFGALAAPSDSPSVQSPAAVVLQGKVGAQFHGTIGKQSYTYWSPPAGRVTIANTLGKKPYSYRSQPLALISNPMSQSGAEQWWAVAIKPKTTATVTEIVEALSYSSGPHLATIALLADKNGSPGAVLYQKTVKVLQAEFDCCAVVVDHVTGDIKVTAGKTYWVAAILPDKKEATTASGWNFATNAQTGLSGFYNGTTWSVGQNSNTAFAVFGK